MKRKQSTPTIAQIAAATGFSSATVSRVLSGSEYPVKRQVRDRVFQAASEMGYKNRTYRAGQGTVGEFKDIGVIVPTLTNPFYYELIAGIRSECNLHGYTSMICSSQRQSEMEVRNIDLMLQKGVQGLIVSSLNETSSSLSLKLNSAPHIVVFDQAVNHLDVSYVMFDHFEAGRLATEYLMLRGHRKICFMTPPITRETRRELFNGYKSVLEAFHTPLEPAYVLSPEKEEQDIENNTYDFNNGIEMAKQFLKLEDRPTAIFAINDTTAYGAIRYFKEVGVRVPEDVSLIGCDNLFTSSVVDPPLTTVNQPAYETGRLTCKILLSEIAGESTKTSHIILRPSIVERLSVKTL